MTEPLPVAHPRPFLLLAGCAAARCAQQWGPTGTACRPADRTARSHPLVDPVAAGVVPRAVAALLDAVAGEPTALWSPRDRARLRLLRRPVDPEGMFAAPPPP